MKTQTLAIILLFSLVTPHTIVKAELPPYADSCIFATVAGTAFYVGHLFSDTQFLGSTVKDFAAAVGVYALWRGYNQLNAEKPATPAQIAATTTYDSLCVTGEAVGKIAIDKLWEKLPPAIKNHRLCPKSDTKQPLPDSWLYSLGATTAAFGYRTYQHPLKRQRQLSTARKALNAFGICKLLEALNNTKDDTIAVNFPHPSLAQDYFKKSEDPQKPSQEDINNCTKKSIKISVNSALESKFFKQLDEHTRHKLQQEESKARTTDSFLAGILRHTANSSPLLLTQFQTMPLTRSALAFVGVKLLFDLHDALYNHYFPEKEKSQENKPFCAA